MAPKPKVSPIEVINVYYELKRTRESEGESLRGLNTVVGKALDISPQRVGQVIKKYEAELAHQVAPVPKVSKASPPETKVSKEEPKVSKSEIRKTCRSDLGPSDDHGPDPAATWSEKSREAREKFTEAVKGHQGEELVPEETEPSRGGDSWLSRLNDEGLIKHLQEVNRNLEDRLQVLEDLIRARGFARQLRGSPKSSPRQEQVLDLLSDGKERSFRSVEKELKCSDAAVRNSVKKLRDKGKVKVRKVKGKGRVKLDKSVQDLL